MILAKVCYCWECKFIAAFEPDSSTQRCPNCGHHMYNIQEYIDTLMEQNSRIEGAAVEVRRECDKRIDREMKKARAAKKALDLERKSRIELGAQFAIAVAERDYLATLCAFNGALTDHTPLTK